MSIKNILLIVFLILLLYVIIRYIMKDVNTLTSITSAQTMQTISASQLTNTGAGSSTSNFCYSIWFYINDWNYRYGEEKIIFGRMETGTTNPCPVVSLGGMQNDLLIQMQVYGGMEMNSSTSTSTNTSTSSIIPGTSTTTASSNSAPTVANSTTSIHRCNVSNIPIQKWVNLIISAYGRSLDVYIDGKLVKTCLMGGVANIDSSANVYVTPNGGFSGWTSIFQYWPTSCDPQKAWNIYKKGYGGSLLGNLGQYSIKVSLMNGNNTDSSFQI